MSDGHIVNTMRMLEDGRMAKLRPLGCSGLTNTEWLHIMRNELTLRKANKK